MYKLNSEEISEARMLELIDDLSMFPYDPSDVGITIDERKQKYLSELESRGDLKISDALMISKF